MIVTIHQPEHLPWLGFFNKADQADELVLLDTVQYRKNYFQNRNLVLTPNGPTWLTVPVFTKGHTDRTIADMEINNDSDWRGKHWKTISLSYRKHPFWDDHEPFLHDLYAQEWHRLADLNETVIRYVVDALGLTTKIVRASDLRVAGTSSELLLDICRKRDGGVYLAGQSGRDYLDESIFSAAGIKVDHHVFSHPTYDQRNTEPFVANLSTLDLLLNCGSGSLDVIRSGSPGR